MRMHVSTMALLAGLLLQPGKAHAQAASPWNEHPNSKVRLIAGEGRMLGIELQLAPGWKTYWRMPGDAGVPPSFDWAGSQNITAFDVQYPAPISMPDAAGVAVGYKGSVIFPVKVVLGDDAKPAAVTVEFAFGVCKEICIPVESKLTLTVPGGAPWPALAPLKAHMARVPVVAPEASKAAPLITSVRSETSGAKPHLAITTQGALDVYVEAPDGLFIPLSKAGANGLFHVELSASPDLKELIGKPVKITATTANGGVETTYVLK
jgi:DsbC/DsbD-like thiol-disulfide interchange protein